MASTKKLIVVLSAQGLGNRMRVLASCIEKAQQEDRVLYIVWQNDSYLRCDITDLFQSIGMPYQTFGPLRHFLFQQVFRHGLIRRFPRLFKLLSKVVSNASIFDRDVINENHPRFNERDKTILVATCCAFGTFYPLNAGMVPEVLALPKSFTSFALTKHLTDAFGAEFKKIHSPYIGVHIRRTDHAAIIRDSPISRYLTQIDLVLKAKPTQKFFLATDDLSVRELIREKYGHCFYVPSHQLGRDNLSGVYGGVIELMLLSRSSEIICSQISSYSTTAILLGNIEKVIHV